MKHLFFVTLLSLLVPVSAFAAPASFKAANTVFATSSTPGNAYTMGSSVIITAPTAGDLTALGGSIVSAGTVGGDALFLGGSVSDRKGVEGDVRVVAGTINIDDSVGGDLVAVGYTVNDNTQAGGSVFVAGANASLSQGAVGPVTVYANNVYLAGEFDSDVTVVAGGSIALAPETTIKGKFHYEAPDVAHIPSSVTVTGGTTYKNASYLPDSGTSRTLAVASLGVFILVRILGALILAGLLAGLFPALAQAIAERAHTRRLRSILLTTLLGFAAIVATPVFLILLALTFVGLGVAIVGGVLYLLLILLAFAYAGILVGSFFVRRFLHRERVRWTDGVLGMLVLMLIALIPIIGWIVALLLAAFTAGTLLALFFQFAFPGDESES